MSPAVPSHASWSRQWAIAARLARRELRGGLHGFRILLACLILGVAAIAGVGSVSQAILSSLASDAREILGGDVALRLIHRPATAEQQDHLAASGDVAGFVDLRAMARANAPGNDRRALVELKAVDGLYPLYGELTTEPQLIPDDIFLPRDGLWGAAVDANLLERLELKLGQQVMIGELPVELRAIIAHEPDRASGGAIGFSLGPRVMISKAALPDTGLVQPGSLVYYVYRLRLPESTDPAIWSRELAATFPDAGWRIRTMDEAAPSLTQLIGRTTLFLTLVGLTALLVGGVGVANAVRAYLESKTGVIATFKCLGASSWLIFRVYLLQIMALTAVGVVVGVILGAATPLLAGGLLSDFLEINIRFALFPAPLLLAAVFGVLTALAFATWPLARAGDVPAASLFRSTVAPLAARPRPAYIAAGLVAAVLLAGLAIVTAQDRGFATWFVGGAIGALLTFQLAGHGIMALARRVPRVRIPALRLALANLHRPGAPTPSVVLSLGLGLTVLVAVALIQANMSRQIMDELPAEAPAFFFLDIQPDQVAPFETLVATVDGVQGSQQVPMLRGRITEINGRRARPEDVQPEARWALRGDRGVTWARLAPDNSPIVAGEWWPADYAGPPLVSFDAETAAGLGLAIGDHLTINVLGRNLEAEVANLREIEWGSLAINFMMIFSPGILEAAPRMHIATVFADVASEGPLERAVTDRFANISAIRVRDALATVNRVVQSIASAVRLTASVTLLAGTLVLAGAVAAGHRRRVYDAVILKVVGATRRHLLTAFLLEYGLLGIITAAIAGLLGSVAAWAILTKVMEIPWQFEPGVVFATGIGCTLITLTFGFAGTWRALSHKAAPLLRNE